MIPDDEPPIRYGDDGRFSYLTIWLNVLANHKG